MARRITQAMFDSVVLENIEEFEMTPDEAVVEAIQQFEAQVVETELFILKICTVLQLMQTLQYLYVMLE